MMVRFLGGLVLGVGLMGCGGPQGEHMIDVPAEKSKYFIMEMKDAGKDRAHVLNREEHEAKTFFHLREINCKRRTSRFLGTGRTVEEARDTSKPGVFGPLVDGSGSALIADYACTELGLS